LSSSRVRLSAGLDRRTGYTHEATAKNGDRTGFKQMWADMAKHRFDLLLFWSLDRLTREGTYKTLTYLRRLTDAGVKFKNYTEQYVDSLGVFGEAIIGVLVGRCGAGADSNLGTDEGGAGSRSGARHSTRMPRKDRKSS